MANPPSLERRRLLKLGGGLLVGGALVGGGWTFLNRGRNLFQVRRERTLMQTSVSVNVFSADPNGARRAIEAAFDRMAAVAAILTRFDPRSPVARLNREGHLTDPPYHMRKVVGHALELSAETDGDFDITVEPVLDYYLGLPRPVTLDSNLRRIVAEREACVGYKSIAFDGAAIRFARSGMGITLDGIAKGYVVDQGIAALRQAGIGDALIDAGGDIRAIARADGKRSWNVGIVDPQQANRVAAVVRVSNAALSTSGNYQVFFTADRRVFHIINPHTGYSPTRYSSVTVVASEAIESDALGVAAFSMDLPRLREVMAARRAEWLAFSWDGATRWRSQDLPQVAGEARSL